MRKPKAK
jgi:hypothetical protein